MLKVKLLNENATLPTCAHPGEDLGFDIFASEDVELKTGVPVMVPTGIAVQYYSPWNGVYGFLVRDRSSMAKKGIFCTGGVIDAGYTGEVIVFLTDQYSRGEPYVIRKGDKIAQLVPIKVRTEQGVIKVNTLEDTARGVHGFGSTGRRIANIYG